MLHFSKPPSRSARKVTALAIEPSPKVEIAGREANLDALGASAYADLLAEVADQPETLERVEYALSQSLQQGRQKEQIPDIAPPGEMAAVYPSRLLGRLERLALLGSLKGTLRPRACMELGLFEFYREKRARTDNLQEDVTSCPFGEAYAALGLEGHPQGGYSAAVFFFTKAVRGSDPSDQWGEVNMRSATALADIALVLWAWGDRAGALELLEEAMMIFHSLHNSTQVAKIRKYIDTLRDEGPLDKETVSPVALEIKQKLRPPQNMP